MANANYFGFTHGGTQYGAQPATAYPAAAQTTYVQPAHQTAYATVPRAQAYDTYQATHTTGQYAYATRTQVQQQPSQPAAAYDTSKTYYTPTVAAAPAATTAVYTIAETPYQPAKPAYSTTSYSTSAPHRTSTTGTKPVGHSTSQQSYVYTNSSSVNTTTHPAGSTGYDAALYSAATNYYQQQHVPKAPTSGGGGAPSSTTTTWQSKKPFIQKPKSKPPPKQPQLHYCEVCKISCAGPQTYREHLEGQKHKKKEAAAKGANPLPTGRGQNQLRCELCDVACTGSDAYAAHIRGTKHQKVLKLHTRLGKPIPSSEPTVVSGSAGSAGPSVNKPTTGGSIVSRTPVKPSATATTVAPKKILATPKITFVGGTQLKSTGAESKEVKKDPKQEAAPAASASGAAAALSTSLSEDKGLDLADNFALPGEKDITPVGEEYIDEVRNELGNVVSFNCKLCECKFNDPNAKIMHLKGRRHRLQYKKKVDPSLQVEVKPSIRIRKIQEEKLRRQAAKEEYWRRRDAEERWRMEWEQRRYEEYVGWQRGPQGRPFAMGGPGMPPRRPDTSDDRHVLAKHQNIYPNEAELAAVQNIVSSCEKALKLVSDFIADSDAPHKPMETEVKKDVKEEKTEGGEKEAKEGEKKDEPPQPPRALKGVMRVGVLAKGLLLHGDLTVHLVVLCSEKPTRTLLERVADSLPKQLATVTEEKYELKRCVEEAALIVTSEKDPRSTCTVTMTSPIMRDENNPEGESSVDSKPDPPDVLDRQKCLDALAALRHAKWFQARANGLQSCVIVIRILRDLCQRVPTWTPLSQWAMELLVEKCVSSAGTALNPGDALRRVFECIASGILLPGGPGLYDPCEKEPCDAASSLSAQEREDITASAQHALRLIAFRQIHKVLGMDPLPTPKHLQGKRLPRKRRRTNSTGEGADGEGEGKKDKKEDGEPEETKEEAKA